MYDLASAKAEIRSPDHMQYFDEIDFPSFTL